jgi:iron complex outermembrane receptor protein
MEAAQAAWGLRPSRPEKGGLMRKRALMTACALGALGLAAGAAHAATATAASATPTIVGDIVVTAEKREASIQHVPTAISAYSSKMRDLVGIDTLNDLQNFVPGLRYAPALDRIYLRGVGRQTNNLATDPGVATYIDGVYDSATYDAGGDELFIARTEVLRGPQGTLYGRNSIGGDINVISQMPTKSYYTEGRFTIGNYGRYEAEAVGSGPITDWLRFRLGGSYIQQNKGYFTNVAIPGQTEDGNGTWGYFEGQLEANVGTRLDLWGKAYIDSSDSTYRSTNVVSPYDTREFLPDTLGPNFNYAFNPAFAGENFFALPGHAGGFTQAGHVMVNPGTVNQWLYNTFQPNEITIRPNYGFVWHATYHADGFDVKYVGGWQHHLLQINSAFGDTPVTSLTFPVLPGTLCAAVPGCTNLTASGPVESTYTEEKTWTSHELDFISNTNSPLQWIAGLYYYHEDYQQSGDYTEPNQPQLATPLVFGTGPASVLLGPFAVSPFPIPAAPNPSRSILDEGQNMQDNSYAGFGQIDWTFMPNWKFTGGLRYSYDEKFGSEFVRELCFSCGNLIGDPFLVPEVTGSLTPVWDITAGAIDTKPAAGAGPVTINPATGVATRPLMGSWSAVTGTAGIQWTPTTDLLAYLKYSRGYKSGGFNAGVGIVTSPEVGPETLDDVEGGVKKTFGSRLTVNAAAFYYWYHNMQIELGELGTGGTATFFLTGVPLVENWGIELESAWQATDSLNFNLSYAHLNTDIVKSGCYQDPVSLAPSSPSCVAQGSAATGIFNVQGNQLIDSPSDKVAINATYTWHFGPGDLIASVSDIVTTGHFSSLFNTPDYWTPGYNDTDARLLWNGAKGNYTVILFVKNLFDAIQYDYIFPGTTVYTTGPNAGQPTAIAHSLNPPRTVGMQLQVRFR